MAKVSKRSNYRVVVVPRTPVNYGLPDNHRGWVARCREIVESINRHVDDTATVFSTFDTEDVCSFCGHPWKHCLDVMGAPGCCEAAVEEDEHARGHGKKTN